MGITFLNKNEPTHGMHNRNLIVYGGLAVLIIGIFYFLSVPGGTAEDPNAPQPPPGYVVPQGAIHWHTRLKILINGEEEPIPNDLGISSGNILDRHLTGAMGISPIHTHVETGDGGEYNEDGTKLHLESSPKAKPSVLTLGYFFKIWGKQFNSTCILDKCNGPDGTVKMTVNGMPNADFDRYFMRDGDQIVITFD